MCTRSSAGSSLSWTSPYRQNILQPTPSVVIIPGQSNDDAENKIAIEKFSSGEFQEGFLASSGNQELVDFAPGEEFISGELSEPLPVGSLLPESRGGEQELSPGKEFSSGECRAEFPEQMSDFHLPEYYGGQEQIALSPEEEFSSGEFQTEFPKPLSLISLPHQSSGDPDIMELAPGEAWKSVSLVEIETMRQCEVQLKNIAHHPVLGHQVRRNWRKLILTGEFLYI